MFRFLILLVLARIVASESETPFEVPGFIRIYKNGSIERLAENQFVPPGVDPKTGVTSKDIVINPSTGVSVRIYLPNCPRDKKIPIIVYVHGGAFTTGSAFNAPDHAYMNSVASQANAIAVSVEYRLAPEYPVAVQYNDTLEVMKWITSHATSGSEPWLKNYGDFSNVFLMGFSSGGNVVHNVALRDVHFKGLVLMHPYFLTDKYLASEANDTIRTTLIELWFYVSPGMNGPNDPRANPEVKGAPSLKNLNCDRVMVFLAHDSLPLEGKMYYKALKASGWGSKAKAFKTKEGHGFFLVKPDSKAAHNMMRHLLAFINHN